MKLLQLALVALALTATSAHAYDRVAYIYQRGDDWVKATGNKFGSFMNPIYCMTEKNQLALIYSTDFREADDIYLVYGNDVAKVKTSSRSLVEKGDGGMSANQEFVGSFVELDGELLECASSSMVLESVGR